MADKNGKMSPVEDIPTEVLPEHAPPKKETAKESPRPAAMGQVAPTHFKVTPLGLAHYFDPKNIAAFKKDIGSVEKLAEILETDLKHGLPQKEIDNQFATRVTEFGVNRLPEVESASLLELMWDTLHDKTLILLIVASVVSIILGVTTGDHKESGWIEGTAILIAVLIVVFVTSANDYQKERQFRKLNAKKNDKMIKVVRAGEQRQVSTYDLVVGDVVLLETGDILAADGILIEASNLKCDESGATGESDAIKKDHAHDCFFLSGSQVLEGMGKMVVAAVGVHSFNGKTMMSLRVENEDTPLQVKLGALADQIGKAGLVIAIANVVILIAKDLITRGVQGGPWDSSIGTYIVNYIITAITIVVVAVPEGLPLAVTLALAYSMVQMLKDNNLVRRLEACETMGSATNICSDKTGTLTQNKMTVVKGIVVGRRFEAESEIPKLNNSLRPEVLRLLGEGIGINSSAFEGLDPKGKMVFQGSKTECALLQFARILGSDYKHIRETLQVERLYPFSSARKRMSALIRMDASGGGDHFRLYAKGASEIVLAQCENILTEDGSVARLDESARDNLKSAILGFAADGLRTICLAYADIHEVRDFTEPPEESLTCIGIVGIQDPLRPEVPDAVRQCQRAGITVRMVTGDNIVTAKSIAKSCGIYNPEVGLAMEGPDFRKLSPAEMDRILPNLQVLARSSPTDKQILVNRLKENGEVVAVTGDGTNDGPALKMAHVGFGMGIAGTEVAKEASAIILMDDNFASIVSAVKWGRNVMQSIQKFLQFQLTVNIVAVITAFIGSISSGQGESPLKPVQLLWVNLIMDTLAALALATEKPTDKLLDDKPVGLKGALITPMMWKMILGQAAYQLIVQLALLYKGASWFGVEDHGIEHYTIIFNAFVFMQIFNEVNCRVLDKSPNIFRNIFKNWIFIAILIFILGFQVLIIFVGGAFMSTTPLNWPEWVACIILGLVGHLVGFGVRLIPDFHAPVRKPRTPRTPKSAKVSPRGE